MAADKIIFMVVDREAEVVRDVAEMLRSAFPDGTIYQSVEGHDALAKMRNVKPSVLICGLDLGRMTAADLVRALGNDRSFDELPILVLSDLPDPRDAFVGEMAKGRMKFLSRPVESEVLVDTTAKALQITVGRGESAFSMRKLKAGEWLFREGELADRAFIVKSGKLQATRKIDGNIVPLGEALAGEFVGEMAHITGEPRGADVHALTDCELIDIPLGNLDLLLFSKPTWSKALLRTLCRRLREANLKKG